MNEPRKPDSTSAIIIAAAIFAARDLANCDSLRSPRAVAAVHDAISKAQLLVDAIERKLAWPGLEKK